MNKAEFAAIVDKLLAKVEEIHMDDYQAGLSVLSEFKTLAYTYREFLSSYITEHVHEIESDFQAVRKYKDSSRTLRKQADHYNSAIVGLRHDITTMKRNNKFPE